MNGFKGLPESIPGIPRAFAVGDHVGLDFLNSNAAPRGQRTEWIGKGEHLLDWLDLMGLLPKVDALRHFGVEDFDEVAVTARKLREEIRGALFERKAHGVSSKVADHLKLLNEIMATDNRFAELSVHGDHFDTLHHLRWMRPDEALLPITDAIADLFCDSDFSLIQKCENPKCTLWFYDRTKSHRRRWCTTAICGNQAKVAAHRARLKASSSELS